MPQMGFDMREGTVVRWLKPEGSEVKVGEVIAEIETDKAVVEFESTAAGVLRKVLVPEGVTVPVGRPIAVVGTSDEELPDLAVEPEPGAAPKPAPGSNAQVAAAAPAPRAPEPPNADRAVRASPVARRLAEEKGVDLRQVLGTGPGGRITKQDVVAFEGPVSAGRPEAAPPAEPPGAAVGVSPGAKVPLSRMRQQIARVTVKSKQEIPHFYVSAEIDMTQAMELRRQRNAGQERDGRVSVNDIIVKACVQALKGHPKLNASFSEDGLQMNEAINVGIAISTEEGLIVPAIMDCAGKSLAEISAASKDLIERSKSGSLNAREYTGGTFSISNMGMFDVTSFAAIILPPHSAVLAVGTVSKRPAVRNDQVTVAEMMTATLSVDHRVADGIEGGGFIAEVKRHLENPLGLFV
jgi:pyruvate dehydrogenase E2 component (dihydrolipoamide acetyltransferase)